MTKTKSGLILAGVMLVCMADVQADCPLPGGRYQADVPYQSSACDVIVDETDPLLAPAFVGVTMYCPGQAPAWGPGIYEESPGSCVLHTRLTAGQLMIAGDGDEVYIASMPSAQDVSYTVDPQAACLDLAPDASGWPIVPGSINATNVIEGDGNPYLWHFDCEAEVLIGGQPSPAGWVNGTIRLDVAFEPVYQDANIVYEARLEKQADGSLVDTSARVITQTASGVPATWEGGTVVLTPLF